MFCITLVLPVIFTIKNSGYSGPGGVSPILNKGALNASGPYLPPPFLSPYQHINVLYTQVALSRADLTQRFSHVFSRVDALWSSSEHSPSTSIPAINDTFYIDHGKWH